MGVTNKVCLGALYVFTACAVAGFAIFGRHPELLARYPGAQPIYLNAFTFFARAQVLLAFVVLALALISKAGSRWIVAFSVTYSLSLGSELLGTTRGIPFGPYQYTDGLGLKWFGHVPLLIPLSWFTMALPSYAIARRLGTRRVRSIVLGALILLSWDLALDPAMSRVTTYWTWSGTGAYYGMPWLNLLGWFITGLVLMLALDRLGAARWAAPVTLEWLMAFYAANLLLPFGMNAAAGFWLANAVTLAALVGTLLLARVELRSYARALT